MAPLAWRLTLAGAALLLSVLAAGTAYAGDETGKVRAKQQNGPPSEEGGYRAGGYRAGVAQRTEQAARKAAGLLPVEEGRAIVDVALEQVAPMEEAWDCSHVVHAIYTTAGHAYPYASSIDIYSGNESFVRVKHPRAGDVVAWWGHLGIVLDPAQHSFYSLVRTGLKAQDYESAYWRSRGVPRFYRLRVRGRALSAEGRRESASARPILSEDR